MGWLPWAGNKSGAYADAAAQAEAKRRGTIQYGTGLVNAVFGGGSSPVYTPFTGTPTKGQTYYTQNNQGSYIPYVGTYGTEVGRAKRGNLYTMQNQTFQGYGPDWYNQLYNTYMNQAMPQFNDQYRQTRNQIGFGLANRGLFNSGAAKNQYSELARTTAQGQQDIAGQAQGQVQGMQQNLANAQNQIINQLYQGADPAQAMSSAVNQAAIMRQPSSFAPAINQFSNLLNSYYTSQLLNAYRQPTYYAPTTPGGGGTTFGGLPPVSTSYGGGY